MKRLLVWAAFISVLFVQSQNEEIDRLTVELTYEKQDSSKVNKSLLLISKLLDAENYAKAFLYVDETLDLAKSLNYSSALAEANYYKALIYSVRNDYFNAIDNYGKSLNLYARVNDSMGLAKVNSQLGLLEIERGNYRKGLSYSLAAITTFERYDLKWELASAYESMAGAYLKTDNADKALEFYEKALFVNRSIGEADRIKNITFNIAKLYSERKEHRKAIDYYQDALQLLKATDDDELLGELLPRLGNEYLLFKEYDKSTEYLLKGLQLNRAKNNAQGLAITLNGLGNLNFQLGKFKTAESQLLEAFSIANDNDLKPEILENYQLRIQLDSTRGYFQNAFKWQSAYYDLKSSMAASKNSYKEAFIDNPEIPSLEASSIENEVADLSEDSDFINSKDNQILIYGLIIISIILVIIVIVLIGKNKSVREHYAKQTSEIQALSEKNEVLSKDNSILEESNQVKDKLFSIVSHDLKDSISSIKAFLDLLRDDSISKEEFNELVPELSENANNASSLLYNLLNWSKSQLHSLEAKPEMFNIQDIFRDKIDLIERKVEEKSIILIDESQRDFVYADKSMIEIVIQNLMSNAVKFSRIGDMITISNTDKNGNCLICVEDTGVGISEENISKLFHAANNFTTRGTDNEKGTGLGLSIAKEMVELNNGKIWVESTENVGSKFFIELPKAAPKA
jgi:signal transduction histidine kinase